MIALLLAAQMSLPMPMHDFLPAPGGAIPEPPPAVEKPAPDITSSVITPGYFMAYTCGPYDASVTFKINGFVYPCSPGRVISVLRSEGEP